MGGYTQKRPVGYLECDYNQPWPGLVTSAPSSQIPFGACSSCTAMAVRGRLQPAPALFNVTGTSGLSVTLPIFSGGENVCAFGNLQQPGSQQGPTVIITNFAVYLDYINPLTISAQKTFAKIFTFPTPYPRYARFGVCVIGNTLYFSSASLLGLYALRPTFAIDSVEVLNPGGYFSSTPTVVFSDGGGSGATGTATIAGNSLTAVSVTAGGTYISPPIVNLNGGATFPLTITGQVAVAVGILSTNPNGYTVQEISAYTGVAGMNTGIPGGTNYSAPTVAFIGGGGTGASATAVLSTDGLGSILAIVMNSFGQNYTSAPTVQIIDPTGSGAAIPTPVFLFNGLPFIGGDFMESINGRLVLGNLIGGDGNNTTTIAYPNLVLNGAGYTGIPPVDIVGGGGANASIYVTPGSGATAGEIIAANMGTLLSFTGIITTGTDTITGVSNISGVQVGMVLADFYGIPNSPVTTVTAVNVNPNITFTGNTTYGSTNITSVSSTTGLLVGQPITGDALYPGTFITAISGSTVTVSQGASETATATPFQVVVGNSITMSANATESATETIYAVGYVSGNQGNGFYAQPLANVAGNSTLQAQIYPILSGLVQRNSSQTRYPDRVAWSAPNAYGYFDPNWLTAPGGYNTLAEARGVVSGLTVIEGVLFVGHNGGETETTPTAGSSPVPFAFYPLWSSDQGVLVRYGSMAQYGTTCCFLSNDTAYMLNPSGLTPIGQNIGNLLENCSTWNNGNYPLQGLYGSIVVIEGQMHYLIALSADDWDFENGNGVRSTTVFDYNLNENSWHQWFYTGYTLTAPIYQTFDTAQFTPNSTGNNTQISRDSWLLAALSQSGGVTAPYHDQTIVVEASSLTRTLQLLNLTLTPVYAPMISWQGRTETPSIGRMQSERRIAIEYENQPILNTLDINPIVTLTYYGQQDPTTQTGTVSQNQVSAVTLNQLATGATFPSQILTAQADFGTFTGVGTSLNLSAAANNALVSLVRVTQVAQIMKEQLP